MTEDNQVRNPNPEMEDEDEEYELDEHSESKGRKRPRPTGQVGSKKQNFSRWQKSILKKWFIQHADNPYLKEESRNELALKTGLDQRQVSNWFTNVRKRIWQPIKKKNKNKGAKDLMLKVKFRLESEGGSLSSDGEVPSPEELAHTTAKPNLTDQLNMMAKQ